MDPDALSRPLRMLRVCMHLLVAALLALAAGRAITDEPTGAAAVVTVAVLLAACYAVGPALPPVRRSPRAAGVWLAVLTGGWLVLLGLTPDGVWLAFPLFLLQLHLLPTRWALPAVVVTTAAAVAGFTWHQQAFTPAAAIGPVIGAAVAVATVLGYQALYQESEHRRRLIEQLTATRAELATAERSAGVLAERERLAREIHDTLAQGLTSIQLLLHAAGRALPERPDVAVDHIENARHEAQDNLLEARRFVRALTPPDLEGGSLPAALHRLCTTTADRFPLAVHFHLEGTAIPLPTPQEVALLRIAQSALANTTAHADADRANITLSYLDSQVALDIVDDGVGFDPDLLTDSASDRSGFGLAAMRTRTSELGGRLCVESTPGNGTSLAVNFPYQDPDGETPNP